MTKTWCTASFALGGLNSLVHVGSGADQNYQNYILRALGQVSAVSIEYLADHMVPNTSQI